MGRLAGKWEGNELFISLVLKSSFDMRRGVLFVSSVHIIFAQEQTDLYLCMYVLSSSSSYLLLLGSTWQRNYGKSSRKAFSFYFGKRATKTAVRLEFLWGFHCLRPRPPLGRFALLRSNPLNKDDGG